MKERINLIRLLQFNHRALIEFEILFKTILLAVVTPLVYRTLDLVMQLGGFHYITSENLKFFLRSPVTILAIVLILSGLLICVYMDICAVIYIMDCSVQRIRVGVVNVFQFIWEGFKKLRHLENLSLFVLLIFYVPFFAMSSLAAIFYTVPIPDFLRISIRANRTRIWIIGIVWFLAVLYLIRYIYTFHFVLLKERPFRDAARSSVEISHYHRFRNLLILLLIQLMGFIGIFLFLYLGILVLKSIHFLSGGLIFKRIPAAAVVWALMVLIRAATALLAIPINFFWVSYKYFRRCKQSDEGISHYTHEKRLQIQNLRRYRVGKGVLVLVAFAGCFIYVYSLYVGSSDINVEYLMKIAVTAHRGASGSFPENTMAAFRGAVEYGADWIELDVHQTKDDQIIVLHDAGLRRTTGLKADCWNLTYEEIARLDAGIRFGVEFMGEKIPLLEDVAEYASQNGLRLNVELKPSAHEAGMEERVLEILERYDLIGSCVVTSQSYSCIERIKELNPETSTVYVMSLAYGDIYRLEAADAFSVASTNVTKRLVRRVHHAGKELLAWTVNSREEINRMIDLNVDNIITNDVLLAKECIFQSRNSEAVNDLVDIILDEPQEQIRNLGTPR